MNSWYLLACAGAVACASGQALAVGRVADVSVTDRDSGETLTAYHYRGEYWIAGRPGARYAINIRNREGRRVLAVTSVDGVNVITGQTARHEQNGYVFDPYVGYDIAGWRKSDQEVAAFYFTSIPKSYAARTGRPDNVGVIGVALFRERAPVAVSQPLVSQDLEEAVVTGSRHRTERYGQSAANEARADAAAPSAPPPAPPPVMTPSDAAKALGSAAARHERPAPAPSLGTGHGRRETSVVTNVDFERAQPGPDEVVRIRYDSHANLVAMGVIVERGAPHSPHRPRPFPDEPQLGYVPDP